MSYMIIFNGRVLPGFDEDSVKEEFARLERLPRDVTDSIFIGRPFILKDRLTDKDISTYFPELTSIGMEVIMEEFVPKDALSFDAVKQKYLQSMGATAGSHLGAVFGDYEVTPDPIATPKTFSFRFSGRFGRLSYINAAIIIMITVIPLFILLSVGAALAETDDMFDGAILSWSLAVVLLGFMMFFSVRNTILRLHDLNLSGWFALPLILGSILPLISLLSMIGYILIMAVPGTKGTNKYGPPVAQGHIAGLIALICFTVLMVLAFIVFLAAASANYKG